MKTRKSWLVLLILLVMATLALSVLPIPILCAQALPTASVIGPNIEIGAPTTIIAVIAIAGTCFIIRGVLIYGCPGPPGFFVRLASLARALSVISVVLRTEKNFKRYNIDLNKWSGTKSFLKKGIKYTDLCLIP